MGAGTFAFFLQTLQLLLSEQDLSIVGSWQGLPTLLQWVEWLASYFVLQYEPQPEMGADPCERLECRYFTLDMVDTMYMKTAVEPVVMAAGILALVMLSRNPQVMQCSAATHRAIRKATRGTLCADEYQPTHQHHAIGQVFHRCLLGIYQFCFMPVVLACMNMLIRRCYSETTADDERRCSELSYFQNADMLRVLSSSETGDQHHASSKWLLKADPEVLYLGSARHEWAWCFAIAMLVLYTFVIPVYIWYGTHRETATMETQHKALSKFAKRFGRSGSLHGDGFNPGELSKADDKNVRTLMINTGKLIFTPMYAEFAPRVMGWWFLVELIEKLSVDVAYALGRGEHNSWWRIWCAAIVAIKVVLQAWLEPYPSKIGNMLEVVASLGLIFMFFISEVTDPAQDDQMDNSFPFWLLGVMTTMLVLTVIVCVCPDGRWRR